MMEVLPIPPGPIRAIGVRRSSRQTISSIDSLRLKNALGGGEGSSPDTLDVDVRYQIARSRNCWPVLGLGGDQYKPADDKRTRVSYSHILATTILTDS